MIPQLSNKNTYLQKMYCLLNQVSTNDKNYDTKCYIGLGKSSFKSRYIQHIYVQIYEQKIAAALLKFSWSLKDRGIFNYKIKQSVVEAIPANINDKRYLCLMGKFHIRHRVC